MKRKLPVLQQIWILAVLPLSLQAQTTTVDSASRALLILTGMSYHLPGGDFAGRFGGNAGAGCSLAYKTRKNLLISLSGNFIFGNNVKEDSILSAITTSDGYIIGADGMPADVSLEERGYWFMGDMGTFLNFRSTKPGSGILLTGGGGFVQHKILIRTGQADIPQLGEDYKKGYDRLSNGGALHQTISFMHLDKKRYFNFLAGIEFIQAFTRNRRDINLDNGIREDALRTDLFFGARIMWILPFQPEGSKRNHAY